ncbi:MAG: hypothetical protein WC477_00710 [Patescibacteria group bacterium]
MTKRRESSFDTGKSTVDQPKELTAIKAHPEEKSARIDFDTGPSDDEEAALIRTNIENMPHSSQKEKDDEYPDLVAQLEREIASEVEQANKDRPIWKKMLGLRVTKENIVHKRLRAESQKPSRQPTQEERDAEERVLATYQANARKLYLKNQVTNRSLPYLMAMVDTGILEEVPKDEILHVLLQEFQKHSYLEDVPEEELKTLIEESIETATRRSKEYRKRPITHETQDLAGLFQAYRNKIP